MYLKFQATEIQIQRNHIYPSCMSGISDQALIDTYG